MIKQSNPHSIGSPIGSNQSEARADTGFGSHAHTDNIDASRRHICIVLLGISASLGGGLSLAHAVSLAQAGSTGIYAHKQEFPMAKTDEEWRALLSPESYRVLRKSGTERPFTSNLLEEKREGIFACMGCEAPLYNNSTKYDSGTGWPSFYEAIANAVATKEDRSLFSVRTEVHCASCGGHLGHVFDDGPPPTGKRHCINGVSLKFVPA